MSIFWDRFYNSCVNRGTKPNSIAKEIGISSGILTKWKTQGSLPNGETLLSIANHLDCSIDYLLGRTTVEIPADCAELFAKYSVLDAVDKAKILERVDTLLDEEKYKKFVSKSEGA